ncbi:MAG TPA: hypothetical protein VFH95_11250 [Candidatus Kapabacteria bacterium]|nr:hypothetical protein [Candidatus Kapabacteria bacterium]
MESIIHKQLIDFPLLKKEGAGGGPIGITTPQPLPSVGGGARQRWLTIATNAVDRAGDILILEGMDATNFLKNPQFLWQHGASGETISTIGRVIDLRVGRASSPDGRAGGTDLRALVEYASPDISSLAEQVYQMDLAGLLPANSIGFRPIEYEANEFGGYTFTQWELIECSKVELPMNPEAVDSGKCYSVDQATDWLLA